MRARYVELEPPMPALVCCGRCGAGVGRADWAKAKHDREHEQDEERASVAEAMAG